MNKRRWFHVISVLIIMFLISINARTGAEADFAEQQYQQCVDLNDGEVNMLRTKVNTRDSIISELSRLITKLEGKAL